MIDYDSIPLYSDKKVEVVTRVPALRNTLYGVYPLPEGEEIQIKITNSEVMFKALKIVTSNSSVKSILVVLIGGFNRMDDMAEGIVKFKKEIPIFIRMCGTKEEVGKQLMENKNIPVYDSLIEAVERAIKEARVN